MQAKVAWAADGYVYNTKKQMSTYRSTPSVISTDNAHFTIDNVSMCSDDYALSSPTKIQRRRVKSASALRERNVQNNRAWDNVSVGSNGYRTPRRPQSAALCTRKAWSETSSTRPGTSQSSYRNYPSRPGTSQSDYKSEYNSNALHNAQKQTQHLHKSFTLVSRWYQEFKFQSSVQASPDNHFFDRHSRCFNHTHLHRKLLRERPQTACEECHSLYPSARYAVNASSSDVHKPESITAQYNDATEEQIRYTNSMRPRTAPTTVNSFYY